MVVYSGKPSRLTLCQMARVRMVLREAPRCSNALWAQRHDQLQSCRHTKRTVRACLCARTHIQAAALLAPAPSPATCFYLNYHAAAPPLMTRCDLRRVKSAAHEALACVCHAASAAAAAAAAHGNQKRPPQHSARQLLRPQYQAASQHQTRRPSTLFLQHSRQLSPHHPAAEHRPLSPGQQSDAGGMMAAGGDGQEGKGQRGALCPPGIVSGGIW